MAATHGPAAIVVGGSMLGLLLVHRTGAMLGAGPCWWLAGPLHP